MSISNWTLTIELIPLLTIVGVILLILYIMRLKETKRLNEIHRDRHDPVLREEHERLKRQDEDEDQKLNPSKETCDICDKRFKLGEECLQIALTTGTIKRDHYSMLYADFFEPWPETKNTATVHELCLDKRVRLKRKRGGK